jgi:CRP/FNR family transcriptional regulator, cyclic AMP receptor protein
MGSVVADCTASANGCVASCSNDERIAGIRRLIKPDSVLSLLAERDLLALLRQSTVRTLPRHRVLFRCGDPGRIVALVLQGFVKLSSTALNDREVVLEIAGPGTLFGEIAILTDAARRADATTLTACRILAIDGSAFRHALARSPEAMFAAIRMLSDRLSAVTARGMDAVSLPAPVRLAKALLHLAELASERVESRIHIGFRLSQRELGAMTGLTRESINKHLRAWREMGWVELSGSAVTLCDVVALRNYVHLSEPA